MLTNMEWDIENMPKRKPKFKCKKCNKNFPDNEVIMGCGYFFTENPWCKKCLDTQTLILEQLRYNLERAEEKFNAETDLNKKQELKERIEDAKKAYENYLKEENEAWKRTKKN